MNKALNQLIEIGPCMEGAKQRIFDFFLKEKRNTKRANFLKKEYIHAGMGGGGEVKGDLAGYMGWDKGVSIKWIIDNNGNKNEQMITYEELAKYMDKTASNKITPGNYNEQISFTI